MKKGFIILILIQGLDVDEDLIDRLNSKEDLIDQLPNLISSFHNDEEQDFLQVFNDFGSI